MFDPPVAEVAAVAVLLGGLAYASWTDLRTREVPDRLWQILVVAGLGIGLVRVGFGGVVPFLLWLLVSGFTLLHVVPWDERLGGRAERYAVAIEVGAYLGVVVVIASAVAQYGIGPATVPLPVIAVVATVLIGRGLFELGVLYGGADAKAMMTAGLLLPLLPVPALLALARPELVTGFLPFSVTIVTNAGVLSIAIPIALAVRNAARGEFSFPRGFLGYSLDPTELPHRFVWIRDPDQASDLETDAETAEDDARARERAAQVLLARGVRRVWVSPQIPFVVLLTLGAALGIAVGNVLLDLLTVL